MSKPSFDFLQREFSKPEPTWQQVPRPTEKGAEQLKFLGGR